MSPKLQSFRVEKGIGEESDGGGGRRIKILCPKMVPPLRPPAQEAAMCPSPLTPNVSQTTNFMAEANPNHLYRRLEFTEDDMLSSSTAMGMREQHTTMADEQNVEFMDEQNSQNKCLNLIDPCANDIDLLHSYVSQEIIPKLGMEFDTEEEVYAFYKKYANEHSHALASPHKRMFLRSQRTINPAQAAELDIADQSGIAPKESVGFLARKAGGVENLGFIPRDYNNYLRSKRTERMKVGDTGGVLEYLQNMQHNQMIQKIDVANRYKALLRWYSHLAARAATSEQSFEMAMSDGEKTLTKIEAALKRLSIKDTLNSGGGKEASQVATNGQNQTVGGTSQLAHDHNAIVELSVQSTPPCHFVQQQWDPNCDMTLMKQPTFSSVVILLQAQISQTQPSKRDNLKDEAWKNLSRLMVLQVKFILFFMLMLT
ncbi:hypothetical protein COLO4_16646 [Corchorus olitorius]|uniref:Uncharacterized protein n=1 Tax=Corchorus olitorius TaxID=93759 RepID=A0A1R3JGA5_9ROSI|nr:hypothetical protein COLO4_16646 [Corchorus olitorius]